MVYCLEARKLSEKFEKNELETNRIYSRMKDANLRSFLYESSKILSEFARTRGEVEGSMNEISSNFLQHIIYCLMYINEQEFKHWIQEIFNYVVKYQFTYLKSSKKVPTYRNYLDWLIRRQWLTEEDYQRYIEMAMWHMQDGKILYIDISDKFKKFVGLLEEICRKLANRELTEKWLFNKLKQGI